MSPQALRRRMAHGNIYTADKIDAALSRYFREGNLTALRELALLWLADRVDEGLERYREQHEIDSTWATRERIVVPVSGGPESATLMRRAARIASRRSGGEWQALYVTRQDGLTGIVARPADPARRQGRRARRHLPHRRRRRPGRRDPRLRPCRERHPDRDRRQPPWPGLDPAATRRRRARGRRVGRHRRPHRHPRLRRPGTAAACRRHPRPAPPSDRACLRGAGARAAEPGAPPDQGPARPAHRGDVADGRRGRDGAHRRDRGSGRVGARERAPAQLPLHPAALHAHHRRAGERRRPSRSSWPSASPWRPSSTPRPVARRRRGRPAPRRTP